MVSKETRYGRHFEASYYFEALHKVRVGSSILVFEGRRESVQLDCEDGRGPLYRESCHCVLRDAQSTRCLWDIRAEETTIDGRWTNLEPQLNISALVSLLVETRISSLTAGEFLSLLFCLAGDQVAVYFRAQVIDELNTLLLCDDIIRQWDAALVSHCGSEGLIKLKRKINVIDDRPANRRCMVNRDRSESVLGKRNSLDFMPAEGQPSPKRSASGGSERPQLPCDPPQLSLLVNYNA